MYLRGIITYNTHFMYFWKIAVRTSLSNYEPKAHNFKTALFINRVDHNFKAALFINRVYQTVDRVQKSAARVRRRSTSAALF